MTSVVSESGADGRRVLVVGAGRGQVGLIRAVKRLGAAAVVATRVEDRLPGIPLADEILPVDILAIPDVVEAARTARVDAVATSCLDTGLEAVGAVADALHLRGISQVSAKICSDKLVMKNLLAQAGIPTAPYASVPRREKVVSTLRTTGLPAVVKATDLQGSNGVFMVDTLDEALGAYDRARELSRSGRVIIESLLVGTEFGAQALVHNGELLHVTVHGDDLADGSTPVPVGHHVPLGSDIEARAAEVTRRAIDALRLDDCAVNIDLMECDGVVHVIELTARAGANGLPELMTALHGVDYYEMIAREALDLDVETTWESRTPWDGAALAHMLTAPDAFGRISGIDLPMDMPDWVTDVQLFKGVGDVLSGFASSNDCVGQVVVRGATVDECRERAAVVADSMKIVIEDGR